MITLPPFKSFLASNIPSIYDNTLSYYDELTKLIAYLEQVVVPAVNETAGQVDGIKKGLEDLKSYVDHYFDNLDVQEEINNKLDAMAEDGTLADIINQEIFGELNDKIDAVQTEIDEKLTEFPNFFVANFFNGAMYGRNDHNIKFYASLDGVNFNVFNEENDLNEDSSDWLRDGSLQWDKARHRFILAAPGYKEQYDCLIYTSEDFVHWTEHKINLGYMVPHNDLHRWAPDLFIDDNNTIYLTISVERTRQDSTIYTDEILFKCDDADNLTFTRIGKIGLVDTSSTANYLDGSFMKFNNVYYFIVKDNSTNTLELYSTNNIEAINSYTRINAQMSFPGLPMEAPSFTQTGDCINVYAEDFSNYHGYAMMQCKIADFPAHYSNRATLLKSLCFNTSGTDAANNDGRHGNVLYITDPEAKKIILNNTDINFASSNATRRENASLDFEGFFGYNPSVVVAYPDVVYTLGSMYRNITIDNLINPYGVENIVIADSTQYGTLKINKVNGVTRNISYDRRTSQFSDGATVIDFVGDNVRFRHTQHKATLSDFTNAGADVTVTRLNGVEFNGCVSLDFDITVNTATSGDIMIGTISDRFRPGVFYKLTQEGGGTHPYYLASDGKLYCNVTDLPQGRVVRCCGTFVPTI